MKQKSVFVFQIASIKCVNQLVFSVLIFNGIFFFLPSRNYVKFFKYGLLEALFNLLSLSLMWSTLTTLQWTYTRANQHWRFDDCSLRMLAFSSVRAHARVQISGRFLIPFAPEYDYLNSPFAFEQLEMFIKIIMNLRVLFSHFQFSKCIQFRFSFTSMNVYKIFIYKIRHNLILSFQFVFFTNFLIHSLLFWFYSY